MNKSQRSFLRSELSNLEDNKPSLILIIPWAIILIFVAFFSPLISVIITLVVIVYYGITEMNRNNRINDLKFKLLGDKK